MYGTKWEKEMKLKSKEFLVDFIRNLLIHIGRREQNPCANAGSPVAGVDEMVCNEIKDVVEAGNKLAEAAHYVQSNYGGIHHLRLALSEWDKIRSNENGRGRG